MRIVMTGAAGGVGTMIRPLLRDHYEVVLSDQAVITDLAANESFVQADITDQDAMDALLKGADGLIHLGGQSVEGSWEAVLNANIIGLHSTYEAARRQGCQRIIFATTNHVVGFYRRQITIDHKVMPRPDSRYGVSKAFGEALGRMYADKHGMRIFNIRIGNVDHKPVDRRRLSIWVSPRDLVQLMRIGLEHADIHFEVVYGISDNARGWYDNSNAFRLGYKPQDQSEDYAAEATAADSVVTSDLVGEQFMGGGFCAIEFSGDVKRTR